MGREFQPLHPNDIEVVLEDAQRYEEYAEAAAKQQNYEGIIETEPPGGQLCEKYIDSLMYMHDLICDFSSVQVQSRFTSEEIEEGIQRLLDDPLVKNYPGIRNNVRGNYGAAREIRMAAERVRGVDQAFAVEQEATRFLDGLLRTYRAIGVSRGRLILQ